MAKKNRLGLPWRLGASVMFLVWMALAVAGGYVLYVRAMLAPLDGCDSLVAALQTNGTVRCSSSASPNLDQALVWDAVVFSLLGLLAGLMVWKKRLPDYVHPPLSRVVYSLRWAGPSIVVLAIASNLIVGLSTSGTSFEMHSAWAHIAATLTWTRWFATAALGAAAIFVLWHWCTNLGARPAGSPAAPSASKRVVKGVPISVCCSGGGIRSAGFSIGGLYGLEALGKMDRVRRISAVSGGNYAATGWSLHALKHLQDGPQPGDAAAPAASALVSRLLRSDPLRSPNLEKIEIGAWPRFDASGKKFRVGPHRFLTNGPGDLNRATLWAVSAVTFNLVLLTAVMVTLVRPLGWLVRSPALFPEIAEGRMSMDTCASGLECIEIGSRQWWPIVIVLGVLAATQLLAAMFLTRAHQLSRGAFAALGSLAVALFFVTVGGPWMLRAGGEVFDKETWTRLAIGGVSVVSLGGAMLRMFQEPLKKSAPRLGGGLLAILTLMLMGRIVRDVALGNGIFSPLWVWFVAAGIYLVTALGLMDLQWASIRELYRNRLTNSFTPRRPYGDSDGKSEDPYRPSPMRVRLTASPRFRAARRSLYRDRIEKIRKELSGFVSNGSVGVPGQPNIEKACDRWCTLDDKLVDKGGVSTNPPRVTAERTPTALAARRLEAPLGRARSTSSSQNQHVAPRFTPGQRWHDLDRKELPELIVCCAASRVGLASTGVRAESFAISPVSVVHRAKSSGKQSMSLSNPEAPLMMATEDFVDRLDSAALIPLQGPAGWMSTSGAAFASAMGRNALGSTGALLAAFNVDLGIWLPSLRNTYDTTEMAPVALGNLISEIFGFYGDTGVHTFVSDGGHFENLGLTELLERRESEPSGEEHDYIVCFDASNDEPLSFATLRNALKVADVTLQTRLEFDLSALPVVDDDRPADTAVYRIPFWTFPRDPTDNSPIGTIVYAKLQASKDQPRNIRRYLNTNIGAPNVSTGNQLLTDQHFLFLLLAGHAAAVQVCEEIEKPSHVAWAAAE